MIEWFHNYSFYQIALNEVMKDLQLEDYLFLMILSSNRTYFELSLYQTEVTDSINIIETRKAILSLLKKCNMNIKDFSINNSNIELEDDNDIDIAFKKFYNKVNGNQVVDNIKRETLRLYMLLLLANIEQLHTNCEDLVKSIDIYADCDLYNYTVYDRSLNCNNLKCFDINRSLMHFWRKGISLSDIITIKRYYLTFDLIVFGHKMIFVEVHCSNSKNNKLIYCTNIGHTLQIGEVKEAYPNEDITIKFKPNIIDLTDNIDSTIITINLKYIPDNMEKMLTELSFYIPDNSYKIEYLCSYDADNFIITPDWYNSERLVFCSDDD